MQPKIASQVQMQRLSKKPGPSLKEDKKDIKKINLLLRNSIQNIPAFFPPRLKTADLCEWRLLAMGKEAETLIRKFAFLTGMDVRPRALIDVSPPRCIKRIIVQVSEKEPRWRKIPVARAGRIACRVGPIANQLATAIQLLRISRVIAHQSELDGGLLVHGALFARGGDGVILAGPGGVGKTTASKRLPLLGGS